MDWYTNIKATIKTNLTCHNLIQIRYRLKQRLLFQEKGISQCQLSRDRISIAMNRIYKV